MVVDSKRTKNKMDLSASPSNNGPANPSLVAPPTIEAPSTLKSSRSFFEGLSLDYSDLGFLLHFQIGGLVDGKINCMFFLMEMIDPLFSCSVNLVLVGKSLVSLVIHEEHGCSFP
jgi:hypothetical protein